MDNNRHKMGSSPREISNNGTTQGTALGNTLFLAFIKYLTLIFISGIFLMTIIIMLVNRKEINKVAVKIKT